MLNPGRRARLLIFALGVVLAVVASGAALPDVRTSQAAVGPADPPTPSTAPASGPPSSLLDAPPFTAPSDSSEPRLKRFLDDFSAVVEDRAGRHALVESLTPLRTRASDGREVPVDLHVVKRGSAFAEVNSPTPTTLGAHIGDGLSLDASGIIVTPLVSNRDAAGAQTGAGVRYRDVDHDTDFLVRPTPRGMETVSELRSAASPESQSYKLGLPAGATASSTPDGQAVEIVRDGQRLALIPEPRSWDAAGKPVTTTMQVVGDTLTISAKHRADNYAYPVSVDPLFVEIHNFDSIYSSQTSFLGWSFYNPFNEFVSIQGSGSSGPGLYNYIANGVAYHSGDYAEWKWTSYTDTNIIIAESTASFWQYQSAFKAIRFIYNRYDNGSTSSTRTDTASYTNQYDKQCLTGCLASTKGLPQNEFIYRLAAQAGGSVSGTSVPKTFLSDATISLNDPYSPVVNPVTGGGNDGQWHDGVIPTFTIAATDRGLGLKRIYLDSPQGTGNVHVHPADNPCVGDRTRRCPTSWSQSFSYDTANLPEGTTTLTASADDVIPNTGTYAWPVKVDRTPPSTLNLSGTLADNDRKVVPSGSYTLQTDASDTYSGVASTSIQLDNNTADEQQQPTCSSSGCPSSQSRNWSLDTSTLSPGQHTITVTAKDKLGQSGQAGHATTKTITINVDRAAPTISSVSHQGLTSWVGGNASITSTVAGQDSDSGVKQLRIASPSGTLTKDFGCDGFATTCAANASNAFTYTTQNFPEGANTLSATAVDAAGNTSQPSNWQVNVDRSGPSGSLGSVGGFVSGSVPVTGTMSDPLSGPRDWKLQVSSHGQNSWQDVCPRQTSGNGSYSCTWNTASGSYPDGQYDLRAEMRDNVPDTSGGPNVSYTPVVTTTVQNAAPTLDLSGALNDNDQKWLASGTYPLHAVANDTGSGVQSIAIQVDGGAPDTVSQSCGSGSCPSSQTRDWIYDTFGVADGKHTIVVTATNKAGAATSKTITVGRDSQAPTISSVTHQGLSPWVANTTITSTVTGADATSGVQQLNVVTPGGTLNKNFGCDGWGTACGASAANAFSYTTDALPEGANTVTATATDAAGNQSAASSWQVNVDRSGPTGDLAPVPQQSSGTVTVSGTMTDSLSGAHDWQLQVLPPGQTVWQNVCDPQPANQTGTYGCVWDTSTGADGTYQVRARMTDNVASADGGPNVAYTAAQTTQVNNTPPPTNTSLPTISGTASDGQTLTASSGTWSGSPTAYAYQWQSCDAAGNNCTNVQAATTQTYALGSGDVGTTLRVVVTASNGGGSASATSSQTAVISDACTDTWTGNAGDNLWQTAGNWSTGAVPGATDRACINSTGTVKVTSGTNSVGIVQDRQGTLSILTGATLQVSDTSAASNVKTLSLSGGTLSGAATLNVSNSLNWTGGTMSGSGATVLAAGATGTVDIGTNAVWLDTRTLRNAGTFTEVSGEIGARNGALIDNSGTFTVNGEGSAINYQGGIYWDRSTTSPQFRNSGTVQKTAGTGSSQINAAFDNEGQVVAQTGHLQFWGGSMAGTTSTGSWSGSGGSVEFQSGSFTLGSGVSLSGSVVYANGVSVTASSIQAPAATLTGKGGTFSVTDTALASNLQNLTLSGGTLSGAGTLNVSNSLNWTAGTMSGTGTTVLPAGATGTVDTGSSNVWLDTRTLRNAGTVTQVSGEIFAINGALIDNSGTFTVNGEGTGSNYAGGIYADGATTRPQFRNTGTVQKTAGTGSSQINAAFDNEGQVVAQTGHLQFWGGSMSGTAGAGSWAGSGGSVEFQARSFNLGAGTSWTGSIVVANTASVTVPSVQTSNTSLSLKGGTLLFSDPAATAAFQDLSMTGGVLAGVGSQTVAGTFTWTAGLMEDGGITTLLSSSTGTINPGGGYAVEVRGRTLRNQGNLSVPTGELGASYGSLIDNSGTLTINDEGTAFNYVGGIGWYGQGGARPVLRNTGTLQKTAGTGTTIVEAAYLAEGTLREVTGHIKFNGPSVTGAVTAPEGYGPGNSQEPNVPVACAGKPVNCATGNQFEVQHDLSAAGRGLGLELTRTYNSQAATAATSPGQFGYGWSGSYGDHLLFDTNSETATVYQADGTAVPFAIVPNGYLAPIRVHASLVKNADGSYTFTRADRSTLNFDQNGRLVSEADRNGNRTALSYDGSGHLTTITDPVGRSLTLTYNADGTVSSATDPAGTTMNYGYTSGNLTSVTLAGSATARWRFGYDASHEMTSMTDANGGSTTTVYDSSHRATSQTDALNRTRTWDYSNPGETKITNPAGDVTDERFQNNEPTQITLGYGTPQAATTTYSYDPARQLTAITDGNNHATSFGYDAVGNRTTVIDGNGHATRFAFDSQRDVTSVTPPTGAATSIAYDANGNQTSVSRQHDTGSGTETQTTTFGHDSQGQLTSLTDALNHTWTFGYDAQGDLATMTSPAANTTTWGYDADSRLASETSPLGHTVSLTRDALGRPTTLHDALGHDSVVGYDPNGNVTDKTDANGHHTQITYDAENQPTKATYADASTRQVGYDADGRITSFTDGNGHATTYQRDAAGHVTTVTDPLQHTTSYAYDGANNVQTKTDPLNRTTTYGYDATNRVISIGYSDGTTPRVSFGYDAMGRRTSMSDATGQSSWSYDDLGRMTQVTDGKGNVTGYTYDIADQQTAITYPNGHSVTRAYDSSGRLQSVGDWLGNTTGFAYDADSNLTTTTFPSQTGAIDHYTYDAADRPNSITMGQGSSTLASITYTRDNIGQVTSETTSGLPGNASTNYTYDQLNRLTQAGTTTYSYNTGGDPINGGSNIFDAAGELTASTNTTFSYDALGERTRRTPSSGAGTTYGWDQAGHMTSVQADGGPKTAYSYAGDGLRSTQGSTTFSWDRSQATPQLLSDGATNYVYGPDGTPLEQIDSSGNVSSYHHDQLGSTRLLTDAAGQATGAFTYDAYGNAAANSGATTTPLGYAGQFTDSESGLQYLRARYYDPSTQEFTSRDPLSNLTQRPYQYANDNPTSSTDPTGLRPAFPPGFGDRQKDIGKGALLCHLTVGRMGGAGEVICLFHDSIEEGEALGQEGNWLRPQPCQFGGGQLGAFINEPGTPDAPAQPTTAGELDSALQGGYSPAALLMF